MFTLVQHCIFLGFLMIVRSSSFVPHPVMSLARKELIISGLLQNTSHNLSHIDRDVMQELMYFLLDNSPPHLMILLLDDSVLGLDPALYVLAELNVPSSVVKVKQDMSPLINILSSTLTAGSTVRRHILVVCSLQNIETIFKMVASNNFESYNTWWVVLTLQSKVSDILRTILREGTQVIVIQLQSHGSVEVLSSTIDNIGMHRFHHSSSWVKTTKGYEKEDYQPLFTDLGHKYSNFNGRTLRVSANNNPPYVFMEETSEGTLVLSSGFEGSIVRSLSYALNFTYQMVTPADGKWGGPMDDGSVVGMIGDVFNKKAHFALCEITITRSREGVIDFTYPYYLESLTLVSRVPREKSKAFAVFAPFTSEVWISLILSVFIAGLILGLQIAAADKYKGRSSESQPVDKVILNMYRSLLKQDNRLFSESPFIRLSLTFWYLFCVIVPALYSGMFYATLVKPSFELPIDGLTDLPNAIANKFTLVVTADTSSQYLFKSAKEGIYSETWKLFNHEDKSKSFPVNSDNSYDGILNEKFVFIAGETGAMYRAMTRGIRRYYFARNTFSPQFYGIACFTGAPFLPVFNQMISQMVEGGLIKKWLDDELQLVSGNNVDNGNLGPRKLTIMQLQAAFYILIIGYVVASVAVAMEIILIRLSAIYSN